MRVKSGVRFEPLDPAMVPVISAVDAVWAEHVPDVEPTITAGTDGRHGEHSYHYSGNALDFRTLWFTTWKQFDDALKQILADELRAKLGPAYDVVVEKDHIHIERDRRRVA